MNKQNNKIKNTKQTNINWFAFLKRKKLKSTTKRHLTNTNKSFIIKNVWRKNGKTNTTYRCK